MDQPPVKLSDDRLRLPVGTLLGGDIRIEGELGAGGFGITYRARDDKLGRALAVKEHFPVDIGNRDSTMSVHPVTSSQGKVFHWGLDKFIQEAKMLANLDHPGIVRVLRYFEENQTAYMVLDFVEGKSMSRWLESLGRPPTEAELDRITEALCAALAVIHDKGIVHRDIAPDNIIIRPDGSPVLLDFGAARQDLAEHSRIQTRSQHSTSFAIVKHHYSPFEQRSTDKRNRGPWSDVYSLGATLYRAMTGKPPADSMDRVDAGQDPVAPAAKVALAPYRPALLEAVDRALFFRRADRPQTIAAFREIAFAAAPTRPELAGSGKPASSDPLPKVSSLSEFDRWSPQANAKLPPPAPSPSRMPLIAAAFAICALLIGGAAWWSGRKVAPSTNNSATAVPLPPSRFTVQRQAVETALNRLRAALTEAQKANSERMWGRQQIWAADAEKFAQETRSAADQLQPLSASETERRQVQDYLNEIAMLERQASDLRISAMEQQKREEERRRDQSAEAAQPRVDVVAPPPPPAPVATMARRSAVYMKNPANKDDGYRIIAGETVAGCEAQCLADPRCRAMELHKPTRKCNLYDTYQVVSDRGSQAEVAEKVINGRTLGPLTAAGVAPPAPAPGPARDEATESIWTHNRSTMRLVSRGEQRFIYYLNPRDGLQAVGVTSGTLLFNGSRSGGSYHGTARIFARGCPPSTYQVSGSVAPNDRRIEMRGQRPHVDEKNCRVTSYSDDVLVFEFVDR